jgi:uncharacterized protein with HEPN domain
MRKDPKIFLKHILESIEAIEKHTKKIPKEKFSKNITVQDAVIRRIEIIGEAVKNLSAEFKKKHHEIEWREIAGMRDKLIHEYFGVNLHLVWHTTKKDIPKLKKQISELLKILDF